MVYNEISEIKKNKMMTRKIYEFNRRINALVILLSGQLIVNMNIFVGFVLYTISMHELLALGLNSCKNDTFTLHINIFAFWGYFCIFDMNAKQ